MSNLSPTTPIGETGTTPEVVSIDPTVAALAVVADHPWNREKSGDTTPTTEAVTSPLDTTIAGESPAPSDTSMEPDTDIAPESTEENATAVSDTTDMSAWTGDDDKLDASTENDQVAPDMAAWTNDDDKMVASPQAVSETTDMGTWTGDDDKYNASLIPSSESETAVTDDLTNPSSPNSSSAQSKAVIGHTDFGSTFDKRPDASGEDKEAESTPRAEEVPETSVAAPIETQIPTPEWDEATGATPALEETAPMEARAPDGTQPSE
jgi:hypothetical protein